MLVSGAPTSERPAVTPFAVVDHVSPTTGLRPVLREVRRAGTPVVCVDEALAVCLTQELQPTEHADSDRHGDTQSVEHHRDLASDGLVVDPAALLTARGSWLPSTMPRDDGNESSVPSSGA